MFRSVPAAYVVVFPDAPEFRIAAANDAYLARHRAAERESWSGGRCSTPFPPIPMTPANGIVNSVIRSTR